MATSKSTSVDEYIAALPSERRAAISAVRSVIRKNLPRGFEEGMQHGMIGYYVPLSRYPKTYNGQALAVAALASQKGYMSLYLMSVYGNSELQRWFERSYHVAGKKLDMGKSCVRFKKLDDLPLDVVGEVIRTTSVDGFIAMYEASRPAPPAKTRAAKAKTKTRPKAKRAAKAPAKKTAAKSKTAKRRTSSQR